MAVPANVLRVATTLRVGERVLVRCDDGLLATEYALFDPSDIVLRATDPVTVRETGYITTAGDALARLAGAGVTPQLAAEAARAISPEVAASYARSGATATAPATASATLSLLGPCELFDGTIYHAIAEAYEGSWLDLRALSHALPRGGAAMLQVLHLAAALDEVPRSTPVHLATANATKDRRPGERTHRRVSLAAAPEVVEALRRLEPNPHPPEVDPQQSRRVRDALLARVRERLSADSTPSLRDRLAKLESALASADGDLGGRLSDPDLRAIEQQLAGGDAEGVEERLDGLERARGTSAALRYLRARAAFVGGDEPPSSVAQRLSVIADEDRGFHEAELVAARAWLAAGEEAYARHFARRLAEDLTARDSERLVALEILEAISPNTRSQAPPPVVPPEDGAVVTRAIVSIAGEVSTEVQVDGVGPEPSTAPAPREVSRGASLPPMATARPPAFAVGPGMVRPAGARTRYEPELVESLALPLGGTEEVLAVGDWPTTSLQARTAMTRLARSLARDYRLWYGTTLRCNVLAVDAMQRHLSQRYARATLADPKVVAELQRHGALLSEILARSLGADWVDIATSEPGYWAMVVPPATRCWPIGRVYRFVTLGRRERDLVSYYLEIEVRSKS